MPVGGVDYLLRPIEDHSNSILHLYIRICGGDYLQEKCSKKWDYCMDRES